MKTGLFHVPALLLTTVLGLITFDWCPAQTTTVREERIAPTGVDGTLRVVGPDSFELQRTGASGAITYRYAKSFQYVDESGHVLKREVVEPGLPVTVQSVENANGLVANRVIVHQATAQKTVTAPSGAATTTTTTTTTTEAVKPTVAEGVLGLWEPDRFELNTPKNGLMRFRYSKDTKITDADNKHVDVIRMKQQGLPVTVHFSQEGDHLMADQITVNLRFIQVSP
jgi:hypothetical protein